MASDSLNPRIPSSASFARERGEEVDPELAELPDPPRKERTLTVLLLALTAIASVAMIALLRHDAAYAFASATPLDIGELRAMAPETLHAGASVGTGMFVHGQGMLGAAGAIRYEHPFENDSYRMSPVAGRRDVWVEVRVPAGAENARYVPKATFTGRLVPLDAAGARHRGLAQSVRAVTGEDVPPGAWLLVDGEEPGDARWAVALVLLFTGFALWNASAIARILRRVG